MFKMAAQYAALGWYVLRTYGLLDDEKTCSCHLGRDCGTPGKHPIDGRWQDVATTDERILEDWFDGSRPANVSVALGEKSGIVDIEWDTDEGKRTAEKFGLPGIQTPTYQSHRSEHRIFRYDAKLPQQAVFKLNGLEVRIGGGKKGAQSVFPPSLHASGVRYRWKMGFSPDEVPVADIPPKLMQAITAAAGGESAPVALKPPANEILHKPHGEGDRHDALVRFASGLCLRMLDPHDPKEQQDVLAILKAVNMAQCRPPKTDQQVELIYQTQIRWAVKVKAAGLVGEQAKEALDAHLSGDPEEVVQIDSPFTAVGLEFRDGEWWPGRWRLKVVHDEPVEYVLSLPVLVGEETKVVDISMNAETYRSAAKVACAVLEGTHTVILDDTPEQWSVAWNGQAAKPRSGTPAVRGLKAKLMDAATHEKPTAEGLRSAKVAGWFLDALQLTPQPGDEEDEPGSPEAGGRPAWVRNSEGVWELWFRWTRVWEDIDRGRRKVEEGDAKRLRTLLLAFSGEKRLPAGRHQSDGGSRRLYVRLTADHLKILERLAAGELPAAAQLQAAESGQDEAEEDENAPLLRA